MLKYKFEYEPDVMVCCDASRFKGAKYAGIPSLIVEILSVSIEERDKNIKAANYLVSCAAVPFKFK